MLIENSLFGTVDKVAVAIQLLQKYEPPEGYYVCFSGGKDSVVILDLVKRSGVKFEAWHNIMTIEPPELMKFIYKEYPDVQHTHPNTTMHKLIVKNGCMPLRFARFCCHALKIPFGKDRFKVTGVRAQESRRRAQRPKVDISENRRELNLIHDWTQNDVWDYIHSRNLPYCKLYDQGFKRIGCVYCPCANVITNCEYAIRYPQFVKYFVTACDRAIKTRLAKGKHHNHKTGAALFKKCIDGGRGKTIEDFGYYFDSDSCTIGRIADCQNFFGGSGKNSKEVFSMDINSDVSTSLSTENAATTAITLDQRVIKIQFHLSNMANSAIIIGQELTECKKEVSHGEWANWLENNFKLKRQSAQNFMAIAERFSNYQTFGNLGYSQMVQMLALPEGEEENFIAEKAANGTPVQDMTVKKLRDEIKKFKNESEKQRKRAKLAEAKAIELNIDIEEFKIREKQISEKVDGIIKERDQTFDINHNLRMDKEKLQKDIEQLKNLTPQVVEVTKEVFPTDYESNKKALAESQNRILELQEQLNNSTTTDYDDIKNKFAVEHAVEQFFKNVNFLYNNQKDFIDIIKQQVNNGTFTRARFEMVTEIVSLIRKIF